MDVVTLALLEDEISEVAPELIAEATDDWLEENVAQETGYVLDSTLTMSNAAAPADKVGELKTAITQLESKSGCIAKTIENVAIASFDDGTETAVKQIVVGIEPKQSGSGDPSPTNIRSISGWTQAQIKRTGKNLVEWEYTTSGPWETRFNGYDNQKWQGKMDVPKTFLGQTFVYSAFLTVPSNASEAGKVSVYFYDANNTLISNTSGTNIVAGSSGISTLSFTVPLNAKQYALGVFIPIGAVAKDPMLEYGNTATDYEPFNGRTIPITFPDAAGTVYGATLENHGTDAWKLRVDSAIVDLGDLTWGMQPESGTQKARFYGQGIANTVDKTKHDEFGLIPNTLCTTYKESHKAVSDRDEENVYGVYYGNGWVYVIDTDYQDATSFKTAVSGQKLVYPLATPIEYTITAEAAKTLLGMNNIWADTGNINLLEYFADSKTYIDEQNTLVKALIAPVLDSMVADTALTANDFRIVNNTLYRITTSVASGATLTPNTNCTATTITAVLKSLLS